MIESRKTSRALLLGLAVFALPGVLDVTLAAEAAAGSAVVAAETTRLWEPALRMVASLGAVLAALGGCAWLAARLRRGGRFRSGLIEVISGISLGGREKVVLLRVGNEQVLVGLSPAGMRALHVLENPARPFAEILDEDR